MRRRVRLAAALLGAVLLLSGCWQAPPAEQQEGLTPMESIGEIPEEPPRTILPKTFSLPYAPDQSLDPLTCPDGMQWTICSLLYEGLFRLTPSLEVQAQLCSQWSCSPDALVHTFTLRPGVAFSDGTPLTAADVKATLDRARTSERYRARLAHVVSVQAGDGAVTVTLNAPNTALAALLDIPIIKQGTERTAVPTGTGPYLFSDTAEGALLVSNQSWWQGSGQPVDRIALAEAADRDTMLYRFTSHDVQLITADLTGTSPIIATGNTGYQDTDTTILHYLGMNTAREPLNNTAFRKALNMGFNRSYVVSAFLSGHGTAAQFPVSPVSPLYPADLAQPYSSDGFTAALAASGYVPSRTLELLVNSENSFKTSVADYLAKTFTAAGVPMEVRVLPWAEYSAALASGSFDLYYGEVRLTADWDLTALLGTGGSLNYGGWSNVQTDLLLSALATSQDRTAAMRSLCSHLLTAAPILPVCFKSTSVLMQTNVLEGLVSTASAPFYGLTDCIIYLRT